MKTGKTRLKVAIAVLVVATASAGMAAFFEYGRRSREESRRRGCASCLTNIACLARLYADEHGGDFPGNLGRLYPSYLSCPRIFICPNAESAVPFDDKDLPPGAKHAADVFRPENTSYAYVSGLTDKVRWDWVLVFEKASRHSEGRMVALVGNHLVLGIDVVWMTERQFKQALERTLREARAAGYDARIWGYGPGEVRDITAGIALSPEGEKETEPQRRPTRSAPQVITPSRGQAGTAATIALTLDLAGNVTMELVFIPAGEFMMGSPDSESGRHGGEGPQHRVRITRAFYMGKHEVTQSQYERIIGTNPSWHKCPDNPVYNVSWAGANDFCRKLSQRTGRKVRLPTEAEWEYSCRAGSTTRFCFGDNENGLDEYAWYYGKSGRKMHPVGLKRANAWGLHDMHGNVSEWCGDWLGKYPSGTVTDPTGPISGQVRVVRGGCWRYTPLLCRSAFRWGSLPEGGGYTGFRVVVLPSPGR